MIKCTAGHFGTPMYTKSMAYSDCGLKIWATTLWCVFKVAQRIS